MGGRMDFEKECEKRGILTDRQHIQHLESCLLKAQKQNRAMREALIGLIKTHGEPCKNPGGCQAVTDGNNALSQSPAPDSPEKACQRCDRVSEATIKADLLLLENCEGKTNEDFGAGLAKMFSVFNEAINSTISTDQPADSEDEQSAWGREADLAEAKALREQGKEG